MIPLMQPFETDLLALGVKYTAKVALVTRSKSSILMVVAGI